MSEQFQDDEEIQQINPELAVHFHSHVVTPVYEPTAAPEETISVDSSEPKTPVEFDTDPTPVSQEDQGEDEEQTEWEDESIPFVPEQKKVDFLAERQIDSESTTAAAIIAFMRESPATFEKILQNHQELFRNIEDGEVAADEKTLEWLETLHNAIEHADTHETPRRATEREGSQWRQYLMHEGSKIGPSRPKIKLSDKPSKSDMLSFLTRKSGMGATHEFPMPHTGIWVRLRTPTNTEVANMIQRLQNISVRLGRETKGQGFSNRITVYNNALTELALQCITYTNMVATTPGDIEHRLSALDEPLLHHALATTMYPGGFNYRHACVADPSKCTHVEEAKIDMFSLTWFDITQLNQRQRDMLRIRWSRQLRNEELDQYAQDTTLGRRPIKWFDNVGVRLRVPSVAERRDAGNRWIDGIVDITHSAFNEAPGEAGRNAYITRLGAITGARQYSHWVDAIYIREDGADTEELLTEDEEIIDSYLSDVMSDKKYSSVFEATVLEFIDEVILAMVAVPSWNCTVCSSPMAKQFHERFEHLIPIDVVSTFFTLAGQKVNQ